MGAKGSCRSPNGGGCPFPYALHIAKVALFHPTIPSPFPAPIVADFQTIGAKRGKSEFFLARFGVFSGKSETEKGKNKNLFYFWGFRGAAFILFCGGGGRVHRVQVVQGARASGVLWCVFRCFCSLSRFVFVGLSLKYAFIRVLRAFLARFGVVVRVCVVLVLCVACGAFVCVSG